MTSNKAFIETNPTEQDFDEVLTWLKVECEENYGSGFYNNKNFLDETFKSGNLIILKENKKSIGLAAWSEYNSNFVDLEIFAIHPDYRNSGYGKFFFTKFSDFFKSKGFEVIKLRPMDEESEHFWCKIGFCKNSATKSAIEGNEYYLIIVETAQSDYSPGTEKIELRGVDELPGKSNKQELKWTWYVDNINGILSKPIIIPCNCDWNLRWSIDGNIIKEGKVKYFTNNDDVQYISNFLHIATLTK